MNWDRIRNIFLAVFLFIGGLALAAEDYRNSRQYTMKGGEWHGHFFFMAWEIKKTLAIGRVPSPP